MQKYLSAITESFIWHHEHECDCVLVTEVISIPCGGISGQQLFEYMRNHDKGYGMRTIYMAPSVFDITLETQVRDMYFISAVCSDNKINRTSIFCFQCGKENIF